MPSVPRRRPFHPAATRAIGTPVLLSLAMLLATIAGCGKSELPTGSKTIQVEHQKRSALLVSTKGTVVIVRGNRKDVEITANIHARTQDRIDATSIKAVRLDDGTLSIKPAWPEGGREAGETCDLNIGLPDAWGITVQTSRGEILLQGMAGPADLSTGKGRITVTAHDGPIQAQTTKGRIELTDVSGSISAESSDGSILIRKARGAVNARTADGRIKVSLANRSIGPVEAHTDDGEVRLEVPPGFAGAVKVHVGTGSLSLPTTGVTINDASKTDATLRFGAGGATSTLDATTGSIAVSVRGQD